MLEIDGSQGEGGGQVLRTASALSAIIGKPCRIFNIRSKRSNPGLREQHLQGLLSLAKLCNGKVGNAKVGSTEIIFYPGNGFSKEIGVNIPTAGAVTLVLQSMMLPAAFAKHNTSISIKGGATNTAWSPPADHITNVLFPMLKRMGYPANLTINSRGFYPKGGADVACSLGSAKVLKPLSIKSRGDVSVVNGISLCAGLSKTVAERQKKAAGNLLKGAGYDFVISESVVGSPCPGSAIVLWADCKNSVLGADSLGEIRKPAEKVGEEAAKRLIKELDGGFSLDAHTADQLIPYMALADGSSVVTTLEITPHTLTNIGVAEKILGVKFCMGENEVSVDGCSFKADRNV